MTGPYLGPTDPSVGIKPFYGPRHHPLGNLLLKSWRQKFSKRGDIPDPAALVLVPWTYYETFWTFLDQDLHISTAFLGSKKVAKKTKYDVMY